MFRRQIEVIGLENQKKLEKKSIMIIGCGGLGNIIATSLSCVGLREIYLVDFDEIEIHNIHRQFQFGKNDIGKKKCDVLGEKIDRCNSKIIMLTEIFNDNFIEKYKNLKIDLIIDATDNFEVRLLIDKYAKMKNSPWIYSSVEEWIGQVGIFKKTSFDVFAIKNHKVGGQIPTMVNLVGSFASNLALKELLIPQKEVLYFIDFKKDFEIKKFYFNC